VTHEPMSQKGKTHCSVAAHFPSVSKLFSQVACLRLNSGFLLPEASVLNYRQLFMIYCKCQEVLC